MPEPSQGPELAGRRSEILPQDNRFVVEKHAKRVSLDIGKLSRMLDIESGGRKIN